MTIEKEYFEWLCNIVCDSFSKQASYEKLLAYLHSVAYKHSLPMDENRAEDGISMRYRFARTKVPASNVWDIMCELDGECSMLEMMVALAVRCEEWMDDTSYGDRTGQWFWQMIVSLGIGGMTNARFDWDVVEPAIHRFLNQDYNSDGRGGLFTIRDCPHDLRGVQIWYQMCWYLDSIT